MNECMWSISEVCLVLSAIHVWAVFGGVVIIRKQALSLWGQESLVISFVWGSGDLDSDPSSSFPFHVTSGKLQPFLGCKNIIILHLVHLAFVNEAWRHSGHLSGFIHWKDFWVPGPLSCIETATVGRSQCCHRDTSDTEWQRCPTPDNCTQQGQKVDESI